LRVQPQYLLFYHKQIIFATAYVGLQMLAY
jgi:hypothetical protein